MPPGQPQQEIWDISITPVFPLERAARTPLVPYLEINFLELRLAYRL